MFDVDWSSLYHKLLTGRSADVHSAGGWKQKHDVNVPQNQNWELKEAKSSVESLHPEYGPVRF